MVLRVLGLNSRSGAPHLKGSDSWLVKVDDRGFCPFSPSFPASRLVGLLLLVVAEIYSVKTDAVFAFLEACARLRVVGD